MKRFFITIILVLLVFVLPACSMINLKTNTISTAQLTDREDVILHTAATDWSFVFDYKVDNEFKEVSLWIEKYEFGELVNDRLSYMTAELGESGAIVFATSKVANKGNPHTFNVGIGDKNGMASMAGIDMNSSNVNNMGSVSGNFPENQDIDEEALILAYICYSSNEYGVSGLSTDFYENPEANMNELKEHDVTYLLKAEFRK